MQFLSWLKSVWFKLFSQFHIFVPLLCFEVQASVPGASNKLCEWVSDWVRDFSQWASSGGRERRHLAQRLNPTHSLSLGDEDDARTSNTRIAQRKRMMPHSTIKSYMYLIADRVLVKLIGRKERCIQIESVDLLGIVNAPHWCWFVAGFLLCSGSIFVCIVIKWLVSVTGSHISTAIHR